MEMGATTTVIATAAPIGDAMMATLRKTTETETPVIPLVGEVADIGAKEEEARAKKKVHWKEQRRVAMEHRAVAIPSTKVEECVDLPKEEDLEALPGACLISEDSDAEDVGMTATATTYLEMRTKTKGEARYRASCWGHQLQGLQFWAVAGVHSSKWGMKTLRRRQQPKRLTRLPRPSSS